MRGQRNDIHLPCAEHVLKELSFIDMNEGIISSDGSSVSGVGRNRIPNLDADSIGL